MDWTGFSIPFNMQDILNGVLMTFNSFKPLVYLALGLAFAVFMLDGLLSVFVRKEPFLPWNR